MISKINSSEIELEVIDSSILRISDQNFACDINLQDEKRYPTFSFEHEGWQSFSFNPEIFQIVKDRIVKCVAVSEINQITTLTGVLFDHERLENEIEIIGTDSFHLAYFKTNFNGPKFKFVLPTELLWITSEIGIEKQNIEVFIKDNKVIVKVGNYLINCHLIEGQYPSAIKAILEENKYHFEVTRKEILSSIELANVLLANNTKPTILLKLTSNELKIQSRSDEQGSSQQLIKLKNAEVEETTICLNSKYLINLIKNIKSETVIFEFNSAAKPIFIKEPNNKNYISLVLPIKTNY